MAGNENSGRKSKYDQIGSVQTILSSSAIEAAAILDRHIQRKKGHRKLPYSLQRACEYVIDHAIGKARQKVELSGGVMTYAQLAKDADKITKDQPELLVDADKVGKN